MSPPQRFVVLALLPLLGCADGGGGAPGTGGSTSSAGAAAEGGAATGGGATGGANAGGAPAGGGGSASGGQGGAGGAPADLGWPFDDSVPTPCEPTPLGEGGSSWTGWANLQYPASLSGEVGQPTDLIYGQAYAAGVTSVPGASSGWEAELGVGPLGTLPEGDARCWSFKAATYNTDVGNNDEYQVSLNPDRPGLFGLAYRVRPPGGAWRYGDLNGSDDGLSASQLGLLDVSDPGDAPLVVVTLNLRCRLDDWAARRPLVVRALARVRPDLVAFQEDCLAADGTSQSVEVAALLAAYTQRGYELHRETTHVATSGNESFPEGISVMSAHRLAGVTVLDLPYGNFPRKAIGADVTVRGRPLRFYATHFDYGSGNAAVRAASAQAILAALPADRPSIVAGDLNAEPGEGGPEELAAELADLWASSNPASPGLTMPASGPTRRIDYVFASPAAAPPLLSPLGARLLDEAEGGVLLSDHLGVAAALGW